MCVSYLCFFKQQTAYEMRISDWSSDVCSSDLDTFVIAAVVVVLPWSTWPIVPTFTCGFVRSNLPFAIAKSPSCSNHVETRARPRPRKTTKTGAHHRNRTCDLTLTKGVLYRQIGRAHV